MQGLWLRSPPARSDAELPAGALPLALIETACGSPTGASGVARAALLLRNGHWHAAHELAQALGGNDGDAVHALLHRMEGDLANACYWHARVGTHASHRDPALLAAARGVPGLVERECFQPATLSRALAGAAPDPALLELHRLELDALFRSCVERSERDSGSGGSLRAS